VQKRFPTSLEQLRALSPGTDLSVLETAILGSPRPEEVVRFLMQWARATTNPAVTVPGLSSPFLTHVFRLVSWSTYAQSVLIQNPDLLDLLLDPQFLSMRPTRAHVEAEAAQMLSRATSFTHKMDRLRRLKQQWDLVLSLREINGLSDPQEIWRDLSEVADALVSTASQTHWQTFADERAIAEPFPFLIVAFGKLGSQELNFSSDIDLVFVLRDDASQDLEIQCSRFVMALSKNLSQPMGRGHLYRVDLRLRPFGGTGTVAPRFHSIAHYYDRYAETWEHLALLRSRVIFGPAGEWESLRERVCFGQTRTSWHIDQVMSQRDRLDQFASDEDFKRGPGGIRDIEFLVHTMQLMFGAQFPDLQTRSTANALATLGDLGILRQDQAQCLDRAYRWLRLLEEYVQIRANQQTHVIPPEREVQDLLGELLDLGGASDLREALKTTRSEVRAIYQEIMHPHLTPRARVQGLFADRADTISDWIDRLPEPDAFYEALAESPSARGRFSRVLGHFPAFAERIRASVPLAEWLATGEILEEPEALNLTAGRNYEDAKLAALIRAHLLKRPFPASELSRIRNTFLAQLSEDLPLGLATLGSHAVGEPLAGSDSDLLLFASPGTNPKEAENAGREYMHRVQSRVQAGNSLAVDFRLRPEGSGGNLVTSWERLQEYRHTRMATWERIALQKYLPLNDLTPSERAIAQLVFDAPLREEDFSELDRVKSRLEQERGQSRRLRSGPGGLDDIEWTLGLAALGFPDARPQSLHQSTSDRIWACVTLTKEEKQNLATHFQNLCRVRILCERLGLSTGRVPDLPTAQDELVAEMGVADFTAALNIFHNGTEQTRSTFLRVKASLEQALA